MTAPQTIVQTIYTDTDDELEAIAVDEESGRIATCTRTAVVVYRPCTGDPKAPLKVRAHPMPSLSMRRAIPSPVQKANGDAVNSGRLNPPSPSPKTVRSLRPPHYLGARLKIFSLGRTSSSSTPSEMPPLVSGQNESRVLSPSRRYRTTRPISLPWATTIASSRRGAG